MYIRDSIYSLYLGVTASLFQTFLKTIVSNDFSKPTMSSFFQQSVAAILNHGLQLRNALTEILFGFDFVCDAPIH